MYRQETSVIRVVQLGLGPIGLSATRYLCEHPRLRIVGAVDIDPDKQGKDLGNLAGMTPLGLPVSGALDQYPPEAADAAVVTTTSSLKSLAPLLLSKVIWPGEDGTLSLPVRIWPGEDGTLSLPVRSSVFPG